MIIRRCFIICSRNAAGAQVAPKETRGSYFAYVYIYIYIERERDIHIYTHAHRWEGRRPSSRRSWSNFCFVVTTIRHLVRFIIICIIIIIISLQPFVCLFVKEIWCVLFLRYSFFVLLFSVLCYFRNAANFHLQILSSSDSWSRRSGTSLIYIYIYIYIYICLILLTIILIIIIYCNMIYYDILYCKVILLFVLLDYLHWIILFTLYIHVIKAQTNKDLLLSYPCYTYDFD